MNELNCQVSTSFTSMGTSQQAGPMVQMILHFPRRLCGGSRV